MNFRVEGRLILTYNYYKLIKWLDFIVCESFMSRTNFARARLVWGRLKTKLRSSNETKINRGFCFLCVQLNANDKIKKVRKKVFCCNYQFWRITSPNRITNVFIGEYPKLMPRYKCNFCFVVCVYVDQKLTTN